MEVFWNKKDNARLDELAKKHSKSDRQIRKLDRSVKELESRLSNIEKDLLAMEAKSELMFNEFGDYKRRSAEQLRLMQKQLLAVLSTAEMLISYAQNQEGLDRAKALKKRLQNHLTRAESALQEKSSA